MEIEPVPSPTTGESQIVDRTYDGITIDQIFPITGSVSLIDDDGREAVASLGSLDLSVKIKEYVPQSIERNGTVLFRYKHRESGGYWATSVGASNLLGLRSREIYAVVSGPGGVCCTNYSIVEVSSTKPRSIYHSEDFGRFRGPMEIFDADGDGVYELVQFDSCLRYFQDDCGSCSPEPRAYFKYRSDLGRYWPTPNVTQEFVAEAFERSDKWIREKYAEWKSTKDVGLRLDLHRSIIGHAADLLHVGESNRAWKLFGRFPGPVDRNDRRQLLREVRKCRVYKTLYND